MRANKSNVLERGEPKHLQQHNRASEQKTLMRLLRGETKSCSRMFPQKNRARPNTSQPSYRGSDMACETCEKANGAQRGTIRNNVHELYARPFREHSGKHLGVFCWKTKRWAGLLCVQSPNQSFNIPRIAVCLPSCQTGKMIPPLYASSATLCVKSSPDAHLLMSCTSTRARVDLSMHPSHPWPTTS